MKLALKGMRTLEMGGVSSAIKHSGVRRSVLAICLGLFIGSALLSTIPEAWGGGNPHHRYNERWGSISFAHPLGTDMNRKDVLTQLVFGAQTSLLMSTLSTFVFLLAGTVLGVLSGYCSGWPRNVVLAVFQVLQIFPILLLLLLSMIFIEMFFLGRMTNWNLVILMALFGVFSAPKLAEMIRGKILALKERTFIEAAVALGLSHRRIIGKHIIRSECLPIILVQGAYIMGQAIMVETTLTFLKLGVEYPVVSWGLMLRKMQDGMISWGMVIQQGFRYSWCWLRQTEDLNIIARDWNMGLADFHFQPLFPIMSIAGSAWLFLELARYFNDRLRLQDGRG